MHACMNAIMRVHMPWRCCARAHTRTRVRVHARVYPDEAGEGQATVAAEASR
jgi:hypothetical protein